MTAGSRVASSVLADLPIDARGAIRWSPDGHRFLVAGPSNIAILSENGVPQGSMEGADASWIDATHVAAFVPAATPDAGALWVGDLSTGDRSILDADVSPGPLGNGHGSVAVSVPADGGGTPSSMHLWVSGSKVDVDGVPLAWSPNGQLLAVAHPADAVSGWLGFLSTPNLAGLLELRTLLVDLRSVPTYDPSGSLLAVCAVTAARACELTVVDVRTGQSTIVGESLPDRFTWTNGPRLLYPSVKAGVAESLRAWGPGGLDEDVGAGTLVRAHGATFVSTFGGRDDRGNELTFQTGDGATVQRLPGPVLIGPDWSPISYRVAVVVDNPNGGRLMVIVLNCQPTSCP